MVSPSNLGRTPRAPARARKARRSGSTEQRAADMALPSYAESEEPETVVDIDGKLYFVRFSFDAEFVAEKVEALNLHVVTSLHEIFGNVWHRHSYSKIRNEFSDKINGNRGRVLYHFFNDIELSDERALQDASEFRRPWLEIYLNKWNNSRNIIFGLLDILEKSDNIHPLPPVEVRIKQLNDYVRSYGDDGLADLAASLFPEWTAAFLAVRNVPKSSVEPLPSRAPEAYGGVRSGESPPDFIKRVYGRWVGKGLTKTGLRQLDPGLYRALYNWLGRGNVLPDDLPLPTRQEVNDKLVEGFIESSGKPLNEVLAEARRIESAARYRLKEK